MNKPWPNSDRSQGSSRYLTLITLNEQRKIAYQYQQERREDGVKEPHPMDEMDKNEWRARETNRDLYIPNTLSQLELARECIYGKGHIYVDEELHNIASKIPMEKIYYKRALAIYETQGDKYSEKCKEIKSKLETKVVETKKQAST
uniref:Uncharacterized protein n=1 Tax=Pristionchus pacificus TaxID=54126 RepID=A0A8R1V1H7_PRIPA